MDGPDSLICGTIALGLLVLLVFLGASALDVWAMRTELRAITLGRRVADALRRRLLAARARYEIARLYLELTWENHR